MIDPGRLNRRLVLEAPVETPDDAGGVTRAYSDVATIWAEIAGEHKWRGDLRACARIRRRARIRRDLASCAC